MIEKIKKFISGQAIEYGLVVTTFLLAELLGIFHPVENTEGILVSVIDFFLHDTKVNMDLVNPNIQLFLFTTLLDIWILVFFTFLDAFRNRNVANPEDYKKTPKAVKFGCFHISAFLRFVFLLVALYFLTAEQLTEKLSVVFGMSVVGSFLLYLLSLGCAILTSPVPGGKKIKVFFKIIKGGIFLVILAIVLFVGGFVLTNITKNGTESDISPETSSLPAVEIPLESNGIFIGTANRNDFYLLPETFSGDEKKFKVTVEYIDKDENQKDTIGYLFVYNPVGWIYYDSIDESRKNYVKNLKDGDVVKNIWQYCYENLVVKSQSPPEQGEPPKKKPMYRYPGQHENGRLVWAGYMKNYGCYLDVNSIHVFDNTSDYKDWEQVVKLYNEDEFVESVTQNFHWDPRNGACVGGRGISPITDSNLKYQFEAGWLQAFGSSYASMENHSQTPNAAPAENIQVSKHALLLLRERVNEGGNSKHWTKGGMFSPARPHKFSAAELCYRTNSGYVYFISTYQPDNMSNAYYIAQIDLNAQRFRTLECYLQPNIMYGDMRKVNDVNTDWNTDASLSATTGKNITFVSEYCDYLKKHLSEIPLVED